MQQFPPAILAFRRNQSVSQRLESRVMRRILLPVFAVAFVLSVSSIARAQTEVTLIAPGGIRAPIEQLIPGFEKKTKERK